MGDESGNDNEQLNLKVVGQDGQVVQVFSFKYICFMFYNFLTILSLKCPLKIGWNPVKIAVWTSKSSKCVGLPIW